jgi:hypothetical protein
LAYSHATAGALVSLLFKIEADERLILPRFVGAGYFPGRSCDRKDIAYCSLVTILLYRVPKDHILGGWVMFGTTG